MRPDLDRPCRIMVAPNGARLGKDDHAALPLTPKEVAREAAACRDAGATAIHLHARDAQGRHTLDPEIYRTFIDAVREETTGRLAIQVTTEAAGRYQAHEQMLAVRALRPDAVSLALRELVADEAAEGEAAGFFTWLVEEGIAGQIILYEPSELSRLLQLEADGVIPYQAFSLLFVLGRYVEPGQAVEPRALMAFLDALPDQRSWMVCAFGREETACLTLAACLGGNLRVGFENSLVHGDGRPAAGNAERVAEIARIVDAIGRHRERLGTARAGDP